MHNKNSINNGEWSNNAALCKRGCLILYEQMVSQTLGSHAGSLV